MTNQTEQNPIPETDATETATVEPEQETPDVAQAEVNANADEVVDPLEVALSRVQELENHIAEAAQREQDIALRARAEIENIRRRTEQDVEKAHKFALEKFAKELLTVVDNLERGLAVLENADENTKSLAEGVELTHKQLLSTLEKFGIETVGLQGEAFNPDLHQAISVQPAADLEPNHVSQVLQKGYTLYGRVIRPAMVMVSG